MRIEIVRGDITEQSAGATVIAVNSALLGGVAPTRGDAAATRAGE